VAGWLGVGKVGSWETGKHRTALRTLIFDDTEGTCLIELFAVRSSSFRKTEQVRYTTYISGLFQAVPVYSEYSEYVYIKPDPRDSGYRPSYAYELLFAAASQVYSYKNKKLLALY